MRYWLLALLFLCGCGPSEKTLKVAATPVPHADLLEIIKPDLEKEGIYLQIIEVDDYHLPNRLLFEKQVDANFFQHLPYLEEQNRQFGYNLVPLTRVHIEPMGIYSKKLASLDEVSQGATVAIPSDPSNGVRALYLLADMELITLKPNPRSPFDIEKNPKKLKIKEIDAPFLPRVLADVDLAVIPANFALQAKLNPLVDALALEEKESLYANIVVVREGELRSEKLQKLKEALHSEKLREHIYQVYKGAIVPIQ